jgi:hypothetical protein
MEAGLAILFIPYGFLAFEDIYCFDFEHNFMEVISETSKAQTQIPPKNPHVNPGAYEEYAVSVSNKTSGVLLIVMFR